MRTITFREVLWEVAFRMGFDPTTDLSVEHAAALGLYISSVVRQEWHATDWPEWTLTRPRTPDARHLVDYDGPTQPISPPLGVDDPRIGRVLKVYLNDPDVTQPPLEIAHRLTEAGIHCGFEHGAQVWVKYQPPAPTYTAVSWNAGVTYGRGALTYSPVSGECYKSETSGNLGHNPAGEQGVDPPALTVQLIQEYRPDSPGLEEKPQITRIDLDFQGALVLDSKTTIAIGTGPDSPEFSFTYLAVSGDTLADVVDAMVAGLTPLLTGYTITSNTVASPPWIKLEVNHAFVVTQAYTIPRRPPLATPTSPSVDPIYFPVVDLQVYVPPRPFVPGQPEILSLLLSDNQALPGATYRLWFHDWNGAEHLLEYVNPDRNSAVELLEAIVFQLQFLKVNDPDPFWDTIQAVINPDARNVWFAINNVFSLDATMQPAGSPWWRWVQFPVVLADSVIRATRATAISEEGQTDKALAEEQIAGAMAAAQALTLAPPAFNPLTDQTKPGPRYRVEGPPAGK